MAKSEIEQLMDEITHLDEVMVYSVGLIHYDHTLGWTAHAVLRADDRNLSVQHPSPEGALRELKKVILSLVCPHCHRLMEEL